MCNQHTLVHKPGTPIEWGHLSYLVKGKGKVSEVITVTSTRHNGYYYLDGTANEWGDPMSIWFCDVQAVQIPTTTHEVW